MPPPSPAVEEVEFSLSELRSQAALQSSESQGAAIVLTLGRSDGVVRDGVVMGEEVAIPCLPDGK